METATFAAGCFWGVESSFRKVDGVLDAVCGYIGGELDNPTYQDVCTGTTGHAEAVQVTWDPTRVSYEQLLEAFWQMHDPTQVNCQGPDRGTQYRSAIFYHDEGQQESARKSMEKLAASGTLRGPIATRLDPFTRFWKAEEYHQRYFEKHGIEVCH